MPYGIAGHNELTTIFKTDTMIKHYKAKQISMGELTLWIFSHLIYQSYHHKSPKYNNNILTSVKPLSDIELICIHWRSKVLTTLPEATTNLSHYVLQIFLYTHLNMYIVATIMDPWVISRHLVHGQVITSHIIMWDVITCPCMRYMLFGTQLLKCNIRNNNPWSLYATACLFVTLSPDTRGSLQITGQNLYIEFRTMDMWSHLLWLMYFTGKFHINSFNIKVIDFTMPLFSEILSCYCVQILLIPFI